MTQKQSKRLFTISRKNKDLVKPLLRMNVLNDVTAAPCSVSFSQLPAAKKYTKNGAAVTSSRMFVQRKDFIRQTLNHAIKILQINQSYHILTGYSAPLLTYVAGPSVAPPSQDFDNFNFRSKTLSFGCIHYENRLLNWCHSVSISNNVVFYASLVVRIY